MKNVIVTLYKMKDNRIPSCEEQFCPFRYECANHRTAGDFRLEGGLTPDLKKINNIWQCSQHPINANGAIMADGSVYNDGCFNYFQ